MTLHEAIEKLLKQKGTMTTVEISSELNKNKWYQKKDGSAIAPSQIHARARSYPNIFDRDGSTILLADKTIEQPKKHKTIRKGENENKKSKRTDSDENYVLGLCDQILELKSSRQHKFDFLRGDTNSFEQSVRLPVDGYYQTLNLIVEYHERQHTENVKFFDKPNKMTISGVPRGEQRKIYDQRRRYILPKHGIQLIEISYSDFNHNRQKRILRDQKKDIEVVKMKLKKNDHLKMI